MTFNWVESKGGGFVDYYIIKDNAVFVKLVHLQNQHYAIMFYNYDTLNLFDNFYKYIQPNATEAKAVVEEFLSKFEMIKVFI